jgi:pyrimidine-nucleoside phosphorylase
MRATDIIATKRDGQILTDEEIRWFIAAYAGGAIPDYQAAAFLMAVYLRGMDVAETVALTQAMIDSGATLSFKDFIPFTVDKHSTGGVGDKTTLALAPTVASLGLPVAKLSGRGLGFSGGTLDKLESIPGFRSALTPDEFRNQVRALGLAIAGQTADLVPADGKLYALRDATATVASVPLIASSVMSKKLAGGADAIVLDVKMGNGAFVHRLAEAEKLARLMVDIGRSHGRKMIALITDMQQPLGQAVGNALELQEAIATLHGHGPADFRELVVTLAGHMLHLGDKAASPADGRRMAETALDSGSALAKFRQFIAAQGGDVRTIDDPSLLPRAHFEHIVPAPRAGYLSALDAMRVGQTAVMLGAGRERKSDSVDPAVGIVCHAKIGRLLDRGEPLFTIHARTSEQIEPAASALLDACDWDDHPVSPPPLVHAIVQ